MAERSVRRLVDLYANQGGGSRTGARPVTCGQSQDLGKHRRAQLVDRSGPSAEHLCTRLARNPGVGRPSTYGASSDGRACLVPTECQVRVPEGTTKRTVTT